MEKITLTTAVLTDAGAVEFSLWSLYFVRKHPDAPAQIRAIYRETDASGFVLNGRSWTCLWADTPTTTDTDDLIKALNKVNLTIKSLERRVTERAQTDGKFGAGSLTGAPD